VGQRLRVEEPTLRGTEAGIRPQERRQPEVTGDPGLLIRDDGRRRPVRHDLTVEGPDLGAPGVLERLSQSIPSSPPSSSVIEQADGGWLLTLDSEEAWSLPERGLTWWSDEHLRIAIGASDPASCRAEGRAAIRITYRDGTAVATAGRIVQTCDREAIHLHIELTVMDGEVMVHERMWDESFARDLL